MARSHPSKQIIIVVGIIIFCLAAGFPVVVDASPPPAKAAVSAEVPPSWLARVQRDIAAREYHVSPVKHKDPVSGGLLQAPNRRQNLRTWFTSDGILVQRRVRENQDWTFRLRPEAVGVAGAMHKLAFAKPKAEGSRVSYQSQYLEQWFENRPAGLEQGFTIPRSLGQGELQISLAIEGNLKPSLKNTATLSLQSPAGATVLEYGHLLVTDADDRPLPARFSLAGSRLVIHVETTDATYPLVIDPLLSTPSWQAESDSGGHFGNSVSNAGDVNNDGYDDVIIGANHYDNGHPCEGAAFVYLGSATGLAATPAWQIKFDQERAYFGSSVSGAGDVNNDGYDDVIVGAPQYDQGEEDEGAAYVYLGSATGPSATASWQVESNLANAYFGCSVSGAGDVNGDGFDDVIIGAYGYANGQNAEGAAYVYLGSATGLSTTASWQVESNQAVAFFGYSVSSAGDVNGDGFDDVIIGAPYYSHNQSYEGAAYVYLGSATGLSTTASWQVESNLANAYFGCSVSGAGDVDNDGYDDVIVGAYHYSHGQTEEGMAFIYLGSATGLSTTAFWQAESDQLGAHFGCSVSGAGDVNGDGYVDVIVGADGYDWQIGDGAAFVYYGGSSNHAAIDFNGDGTHDTALFSPDNRKWYIKDQSTPTYGTSDCVPVPGDYDGDGSTNLAVVDLTRTDGRAKWYLDGVSVFIYGLQEWIPVPGDYDGDGDTDAALFNPDTGKWYVKDQFVTTYGAGGIPVPGDYDGDGTTDIAVYNPDSHKWYIKDVGIFTYGMADCIPVPADYDGDGDTDLAVIDTSRPDGMAKWYIRNQAVFIYGAVADTIPVPGDYDGDGDADPCLFYQNTGKWYCRNVGIWSYGNGDMIPLASNLAIRYAISQAAGGGPVW